MRSVGAYEAKTHLPRLLDEVAKGESITITKYGVPVAMLVPPSPARRLTLSAAPRMSVDEAIAGLRELRKGMRLDGLSIRELIEEGRR